jgi:polysaccharide biosynthesis protein PslH
MVTARDARNMRALSRKSKIAIIPYGVDVDHFAPDTTVQRDPFRVTFVGTFSERSSNEQSILWFLNKVWLEVSKEVPEAKLFLVGRSPSNKLAQVCASAHNVVLTGFVEDVRTYLWRSGIFVVPMCSGSGIKNKLLEAWAAGCAVISTEYGVEGIDQIVDGQNVLLAFNSEQFCQKLVDLLLSVEMQRKISSHGLLTAKKYYGWEIIANKVEKKLYEIA